MRIIFDTPSLTRSLLLTVFLVQLQIFAAAGSRPPNIVFLLADDLGYGDLSCYGQRKFRTPNIDRIASGGMKLSVHYSGSPVCAPSRCVLMTGKHPGHGYIRENRQHRPGGEGQLPVPAGELKLPVLLKSHGYFLGAFGKWGLGAPETTGEPLRQGFDRFFGYNCQAVAHNYYPTSLWNDAVRFPLNNNKFFPAHQKLGVGEDRNDPGIYARFSGGEYAPDLISTEALKFVRQNRARPFFLFYPTTVPHLALQVPEDSLAGFRGKFEEVPYDGSRSYLPHPTPRAAYAAMVTRLDREIGRLLDLLQELGLEQDTIVVFTSDNGPLYDRLGGTDTDFFGSAGIFRGRKGSLYEGGIRVPCLIRWPGRIRAGVESKRVTGFEDWLPTFNELLGGRSRDIPGLDGISFAPTLLGKRQKERSFLYRETPGYGGQQSVRFGRWKAIRTGLNRPANAAQPPGEIELYDLEMDPGESVNLAGREARVVSKASVFLAREHVASSLFPIRALDGSATSR